VWTIVPFTIFAGLAVWMFMLMPVLGLFFTIAALLVVGPATTRTRVPAGT